MLSKLQSISNKNNLFRESLVWLLQDGTDNFMLILHAFLYSNVFKQNRARLSVGIYRN